MMIHVLIPAVLLIAARVVSGLTVAEQQEIVDVHNELRRQEGASDMQIMTWDPALAIMAQNWSDNCIFEHGQSLNSSTLVDMAIGQNMFATSGSTVSVGFAIRDFYREKEYYDFDTQGCTHICGHYTQVVWSSSKRVGCGYTVCPSIGLIFVCNYSPPGNYVGMKPYTKGTACTQCSNGQQYCNNGLCDSSCTGPSETCECKANCQNCGTVTSDCRCQCSTGWHGHDCTKKCDNYHEWCGVGWGTGLCNPQYSYVLYYCPAMCGLCDPGPSTCNETTVNASTVATTTTTKKPKFVPAKECSDTLNGQNYQGTKSVTESGKTCQSWSSQTPQTHSYTDPNLFPDATLTDANNYCRNPGPTYSARPWCYTTDESARWEYCNIVSCDECLSTVDGKNYKGTKATTASGKTCQPWSSQTPHTHTYSNPNQFPDATLEDASNHCRNPGSNYGTSPWCYTMDVNTRWEYCGIPLCSNV